MLADVYGHSIEIKPNNALFIDVTVWIVQCKKGPVVCLHIIVRSLTNSDTGVMQCLCQWCMT